MSEVTQTEELTQEEQVQRDKEMLAQLKKKADLMGVSYSPNIGIDTLRERINSKLEGTLEEEPVPEKKEGETRIERRNRLRKAALKLVRVNISCMNPSKRNHQGAIIAVENSFIKDRRFVPFNTDWHIPQMMLDMMRETKMQAFVTRKNKHGVEYKVGKLVPEYNIAVLPPLTDKEIKELAQRQQMASGTTEE